MGERRFPFAAVAPMVADLTARQIAEIVDAKVNTVQRWRSVGVATIPETTAERLALWLDVHPETIWPDWYSDLMRVCDLEGCTNTYVPSRSNQRFCSKECRTAAYSQTRRPRAAAWARAKYQNDESARVEKTRATAAYKARYRDAVNAAERRRYHANAERERARRRARYWANPEAARAAERQRRARQSSQQPERQAS